jgi:hypothetical protein
MLILSTWRDTPGLWLEEVGALTDEVVLSDPPRLPGAQNRNCQMVSTRAGLRRCGELGARLVLKTRTDIAVGAPGLFDQFEAMAASLDLGPLRRHGLQNRILVASTYSRKYIPYHPSDMIQLGAVEDLLRFWGGALDPRDLDPARESRSRSLRDLAEDGIPAETYLATGFCRTIGRSLDWSIEDSWDFLRDFFIVVDDRWLDLSWYKNPNPGADRPRESWREVMDAYTWQGLVHANPAVLEQRHRVDIARQVWDRGSASEPRPQVR